MEGDAPRPDQLHDGERIYSVALSIGAEEAREYMFEAVLEACAATSLAGKIPADVPLSKLEVVEPEARTFLLKLVDGFLRRLE